MWLELNLCLFIIYDKGYVLILREYEGIFNIIGKLEILLEKLNII